MIATAEQDAFETLWRDHVDELRRFATVLVGAGDAHDVVTDAFLSAAPVVLDGTVENPGGYLKRAVVNRIRDRHRQRLRRERRERAVAAPVASSPLSTAEHADLRRAVAGLSVRQRAVVYLAYWDDLTVREIAELLALSTGTVQRTLDRARAVLRTELT